MLQALAQLIRLPNVFTAPADVIAGAALAGLTLSSSSTNIEILLTCLASACAYAAGMIMNDLVDYQVDAHERPERPLPSG
ncbi:MAG TPA: UbiA family prenyltransferase, partial [Gemmatales bacterium]|nr:UbiA family prenyltransferase [Gemmatales bacterium]